MIINDDLANIMDTQIQIRSAELTDIKAIARLNTLFNGSTEPPEAYLSRLSDPQRVDHPLLAQIETQTIGIANLRLAPSIFYPEPYAEITELFIEESFRRLGAGRALIEHAEDLAFKAGARELLILTGFDNHPALNFYHSLGYQRHDLALWKALY